MKRLALQALLLTMLSTAAGAQTCGALPTTLTNGTVADATDVMGNFEWLRTCINADGSVSSGLAGQVGYYAANGTAISGISVSGLLDLAFGSTQGAILYRGAAGWSVLAPGTSGQVLQTNGAGANPAWGTSSGGGGINTIVGAGVSGTTSTVALPLLPVISRPALSSFSWLNQSGATATDHTNGPLVLRQTQTSGGLNALIKNVAGSDWTVTIQYALGNHIGGTNLDLPGLIVYNSSNNKIYVCGIGGTGSINVWAYNSTTSWNAISATKTILVTPGSIWTRAQYVSSTTTLTFSYSIDGFTWETVLTTSSPFVGVPTSYGVVVGTSGNTAGYVLSLNHLAESSP